MSRAVLQVCVCVCVVCMVHVCVCVCGVCVCPGVLQVHERALFVNDLSTTTDQDVRHGCGFLRTRGDAGIPQQRGTRLLFGNSLQ
jgi:hypothetical protein